MLDGFTHAAMNIFRSESFWLAVTMAILVGVSYKPLWRGWKMAMRVYSTKVENEITDAAIARKEAESILSQHNQVLDSVRAEIEKMKQQATEQVQQIRLNTAKICEQISQAASRQIKEQMEFMHRNMQNQITADLNRMVSMTLESVLVQTSLKRTHEIEYKNIIHALERKG